MTHTYEVIVGNVGTVYSGTDKAAAEKTFDSYMVLSQQGYGRVADEPVTLTRDGEIFAEYEY